MAWPLTPTKKGRTGPVPTSRKGAGGWPSHAIPSRLSYAEDALRNFSLPEGNSLEFEPIIYFFLRKFKIRTS